MKLCEIDPFVRQALVGSLDKDNTRDVNTRIKTVDCRLFYIISGGGEMIIEGISHPIDSGTTVIFSAGTEYIWAVDNVKYYAVNFDYTHSFSDIKTTYHPIKSEQFTNEQIIERKEFEDAAVLNGPLVLRGTPFFEALASRITTEYYIGGDNSDILLSSLLRSAIICAVRMAQKEEGIGEKSAAVISRGVISYINMNYDRQITNEDIAAVFNFHSVYLGRMFKACTGESIHGFLINRRIAAAKEMLRSGDLPVGEVAKMCGFGSLFHFSKAFRQRVGITPSEYRDEADRHL